MTKHGEAILQQALGLEEGERAQLAASILESLEPRVDEREIEQAWREEVRRRVADLDEGRVELVPWDDVRDQLLARLSVRP